MQPDSALAVASHLAAVRRRLIARHVLHGLAAALVAAAAVWISVRWPGASWGAGVAAAVAAAAAAGAGTWLLRREQRSSRAAAAALERATPGVRNLAITAEELLAHPDRARWWMRERVLRDACAAVRDTTLASAVPLGRAFATLAGALAVATLAALDLPARMPRVLGPAVERISERVSAAEALTLVATVHPPAYTGLAAEAIRHPERLDIVEGSLVRLSIGGGRSPWRVRFGESSLAATQGPDGTVAEIVPKESGYFAIEPGDGAEAASRRLLPVTVRPDRAPVIKVDEPGKDLLVPDAARTVRIRASAADDFGLRALSLRYTKVSGSGEQFEFVEGELPFDIARDDGRRWTGRGTLALNRLGLEPGDSLVYRVVARDGRPGDAGLSSSDTFFVEVAGPGQVVLEGFEMPPDRERYALSQQMIVLKIRRLRARERGLPKEALREETGDIAAEQRSVRANFVFLMGGEVEDEEEEAEHSHEIQEGRLENTARQEISRAISHMTYAEQALVGVDTARALQQARLAVDALQKAFGRNRYILRTLPVRSRVDPSRRLSGELDEAGDWRRTPSAGPADEEALATRDIMTALLEVAPTLKRAPRDRGAHATLTRVAEAALRANPASAEWQQVSTRVLALRDAAAAGESATDLERRLREALAPVLALARRQTAGIGRGHAGAPGPLRSAWADEVRPR